MKAPNRPLFANRAELQVAFRNLHILEQSLEALRDQWQSENPELLQVTQTTCARRIADLQKEFAAYLYEHPADVSVPRTEPKAFAIN